MFARIWTGITAPKKMQRCTDCDVYKTMYEFMNYMEPATNSTRNVPLFNQHCRECRTTRVSRECPQCLEERRIALFISNPEPNNYQASLCKSVVSRLYVLGTKNAMSSKVSRILDPMALILKYSVMNATSVWIDDKLMDTNVHSNHVSQ